MQNLQDNLIQAHQLQQNLSSVEHRIQQAVEAFHQPSPLLLAVSKTRTSQQIRELANLGVQHFGENYLQEALAKQADLTDLPITWHFIGPIQANKTRAIAENFDWAHSIDRLKIAERLNNQTHRSKRMNICLQINLDNEDTKSGIIPTDAIELARHVATMPNLILRGLMAIPAPRTNIAEQREGFHQLSMLMSKLKTAIPQCPWDTLSMGMSKDLEAAIAEGSTIVRVGTDLFGPRQ
ncbi:YggS family pyridoxal phosphate-dependent enzyme [Marinibactrum halimedae]|uniref:Pyridoxal phosphate homeostasis protein n=1 Tax=Marinibactrum halimedae TaxID=1444977 RepID=A0AA37T778_9GAMM|nr:YggS family pyridoxal phosphate-dependent enzyme [Marinibactrum halimedae]MCD9458318.1 YggS family pyridoxal phosphate-dependent enzyme [Marinibactrum halimedae]GLS27054.1 YggS family pyridoxal phosphate enzyme [Marinibactrum halimedae]